MVRTLIETANFSWLDVEMPSSDELRDLANLYKIPDQYLLTCLDPEHFPKHQDIDDDIVYIMLRNFDIHATSQADTVREITQKIAVFYGKNFLITIHRRRQEAFYNFCLTYENKDQATSSIALIVDKIITNTILSYERAIEETAVLIERYEEQIFLRQANSFIIKELFYIKRRMSLTKRMLSLIHEIALILPDVNPDDKWHEPVYLSEKLIFRNDQVLEMSNSLMNLHLALESHRTNEVMRILTLFSVFFLPITFIAGVYGMNFSYMPELQSTWGYPLCLATMALVAVLLFWWFKRKGWISS